jgi:nucleotide-binding universal stress UspA family protein
VVGVTAIMRVLLAVDGSDDARAATAWLAAFPLPEGARVRVVSVAAVPTSALDIPPVRELQQSIRDATRAIADTARTALGARAETSDVREGDAREQILAAAEAWKTDLIVVGARGLGTVSAALLGSVSLAITRHASCAVLVVKRRARALHRAVVAVDGSREALAAARFLAALPLPNSCRIDLLGVVEQPPLPALAADGVATSVGTQALVQIAEERRRALEPALALAEEPFLGKVAGVRRLRATGSPGDEILKVAAQPDVDLVVLGARGLGPLGRIFLGSVSEHVLRHAPGPVLIVKGGGP